MCPPLHRFKEQIILLPAEESPLSAVSSTMVRSKLKEEGAHANLAGLVPEPVARYLRENPGLYE